MGLKLALAAKSCVGWVHARRCAYKHFSLVLCCEGFLNPASPTQRGEAQRIEVQYMVPGKWALCHPSSLTIQFTVPNTFMSCDSRPCSWASM